MLTSSSKSVLMRQSKVFLGACLRRLSSAAEWSISGQARDGRAIYLDSQATTPMDPRVLDAMLPYMTGRYGNPHSVTHMYGWESLGVVDTAREQVAALIGAEAKEIIFTSGASHGIGFSASLLG